MEVLQGQGIRVETEDHGGQRRNVRWLQRSSQVLAAIAIADPRRRDFLRRRRQGLRYEASEGRRLHVEGRAQYLFDPPGNHGGRYPVILQRENCWRRLRAC